MSDALDLTPKTWSVGEIVTAAELNTELRDKITAIADRLNDSGWIDIPLLGTAGVTSKVTPQYRIKNGVVYYRGAVAFTGTGWFNIGTVPPEACPTVKSGYPVTANSGYNFMIQVDTAGLIEGWFEAASGAWLTFTGIAYPLG